MLRLEQNEGGAGDLGDRLGVEPDPAQSLEDHLEQGVGAFGHAVDVADDGVERLRVVGEFAALGFFDRVAEAGPGVLVAEVGQGGDVQGVGEPSQGGDQAVGTGSGGVVLAAGPDRRDPERPAVGCGK